MELRESEWAKQGRIIHTYMIPESLRGSGNVAAMPTKVGLVQLTAEQELIASKIGKFDMLKAQYAATKLAIVEFDGRPVDAGAAEVDKFWERVDARVRALLLQAYNRISSPSKEEEEGFFESETISA